MATVTTTGNLSKLLQRGYETFTPADAALQAHLDHFVLSFNHANARIFSYYPGPGSTSKLLKTDVYYPNRAFIEVAGSGFTGNSGSVKQITYTGDPLSWDLDGSGKWNTRGLHSLNTKSLSMWNSTGTEDFTLGGKINIFKGTWNLNSASLWYDGLLVEQKGSFNLNGAPGGIYSSLSYSDALGKFSLTGKIKRDDIVINETLSDLFDNPVLFKGKDTFHVSDNSRPWFGFAGNDTMHGGANDDELYGGTGNDKLYGYAGNDWLFGGDGKDFLDGGEGDDALYGGMGNDTYKDLHGDNSIVDVGGNNKITTGAGEDWVVTGDGKDTIDTGAGDDIISAGGGANKVTGGAGADAFLFTHLGRGHITTLLDFKASEGDMLFFDSEVFTALAGIEDLTDHLVVGSKAKALDADDFLIFDSKSKKLYYDVDGSGEQAAVQIAVLKTVSDLSANDIWVLS